MAQANPPRSRALGGKVPGTAAFSKFMSVLQLVADDPGQLTLTQLYKKTTFPRGTTHRIVSALIQEGLIAEDLRTECLELGPRLMTLASQAWDRFDLRLIAREDIRALRDATGETVHLAVPSGLEMVYVDKLESLQAVSMRSRIGTRIKLHSTSVGKAYLAALEPSERDALLKAIDYRPATPHTILTRRELERDLKETAERGYSIDREETELDIICFGCAIRGAAGKPVGCLSITIPKYRLTEAVAAACRDGIMDCARRISARIVTVPGQDAF
jgi:DNA-binding IclR family transcriptional regulator